MVDAETSGALSGNALMDTMQAAILLERLDGIGEIVERRHRIATAYTTGLARYLRTPEMPCAPADRDAWYTYTVRTPRRDALHDHLCAAGIESKIRDRLLLPDQPSLRSISAGHYPKARDYAAQLLCLPLHEKMTEDEVAYVIDATSSFFEGNPS
jgi:dTDP-4-amino-4,6-dideoxygalactose transaminase